MPSCSYSSSCSCSCSSSACSSSSSCSCSCSSSHAPVEPSQKIIRTRSIIVDLKHKAPAKACLTNHLANRQGTVLATQRDRAATIRSAVRALHKKRYRSLF